MSMHNYADSFVDSLDWLISDEEARLSQPEEIRCLKIEYALQVLRNSSGEDFGRDTNKWREWFRTHEAIFYDDTEEVARYEEELTKWKRHYGVDDGVMPLYNF